MAQTMLSDETTGETEEPRCNKEFLSSDADDTSLERIITMKIEDEKEENKTEKKEAIDSGKSIKILLLGKTGSGKSASGNTILNERFFDEERFLESEVNKSFTKTKIIDGLRVQVTDTPGIFNTSMTESDIIYQIKLGLDSSKPGVHIILLVINLSFKYTKEKLEAVEFIEKNLGEKAQKHIMVLFTHGDVLEEPGEIETYLYKCQSLKMLIHKYNSMYQVFNNRSRDQKQVAELLQKIDQIMRKNGEILYTREMFEEVQKAQEEQKKIQEEQKKSVLIGITVAAVVGGAAVAALGALAILKK